MKKRTKLTARILSLFLALVLLIGPLSLGGAAKATHDPAVIKKGTVTATCLLVRTGAGTGYKLVSGLLRGTSVDILEEKDGWYRISTGWICADYVKVEGEPVVTPAPTPAPAPTPVPEVKVGNATVTASLLFIRKDPSTNYSAVGMLKKGDRIQVLETSGNWMRIAAGWVFGAYVAMDDGSASFTEKQNAVVTANELNIRESPSLLSKVVGSLKKNQKVEILETSGDWLRTHYGWINKNFVKLVDSASPYNTGIVKASALNVRSGPGTSYSRVATLYYGEKVTILENQGDWLRIASGWVNADYIKIGG